MSESPSLLRKDINVRHLLLVQALWETRSVRKAANRLNITQPAATKLLAELERRLEVRLFERSATGIQPTAYADALARHAVTVLSHLDHAGQELRALKAQQGGKLVVGTMLVGSVDLVPDAVRDLKAQMPGLTVEVREVPLQGLARGVRDGTFDLAVGRVLEGADTYGLTVEALYEEPMTVIAGARHPLRRKRAALLRALAAHSWVWPYTGESYRRRLDEMFKMHCDATPTDVVESNSLPVILGLVSRSDRLAVVPESVARLLEQLRLAERLGLEVPVPSSLVGVVSRTHPFHPPGTALLLQILRSRAGDAKRSNGVPRPRRLQEPSSTGRKMRDGRAAS